MPWLLPAGRLATPGALGKAARGRGSAGRAVGAAALAMSSSTFSAMGGCSTLRLRGEGNAACIGSAFRVGARLRRVQLEGREAHWLNCHSEVGWVLLGAVCVFYH